ncbi:Adenylate cyclase [BD1-7 clade bacterium]|uniref:Adenylate cyclase n=1 Tax=BD1-7 clade bacterium TaxID=2029982 RepID=A0A5S9QF35_9GAMM|nr:Adenylate cyclase [BD1-7 clade bacterium]
MNTTVKQTSVTFNRTQQKQILKRFLQITLGRLARVRLDLSQEQQLFLDILPVLLHSNHRQFPCFVSESTPAGVCRYQPSGAEIQKLQRLLPDYRPSETNGNKPRPQILGIYFSGDCGTIIRSAEQNIRIWVCYGQNLGANDVAQLERKCRLIEQWARSLKIRAEFHVVDQAFLSADRQPDFLELDHLYRSGILIAGRMPLWWLIPPEQESNYRQFASILFHKRFISNDEVIDFGGIPEIPADQFIRVSLGQLNQALTCPYSAVIGLVLSEIYLSHYPDTDILSARFKQAVYDDELDLDRLDPHVMVFRTCEQYLIETQQTERLSLLRRCFYLKVNIPLSKYDKHSSWQRKVMETMTTDWGWDKEYLRELDQYTQQDIKTRVDDFQALGQEVIHAYRSMRNFASKTTQNEQLQRDIYDLGFLVNSRFENRAGKIDCVRLLNGEHKQPLMCFGHTRQNHKSLWSLYTESVSYRDLPNTQPLRRAESLIELLTYCHLNHLIDIETPLELIGSNLPIDENTLQTLSQQTLAFIEHVQSQPATSLEHPRHTQVFVLPQAGPDITSGRHALSGRKPVYLQEQIARIDVLCLNRVGEYILQVFDGSERLPQALCCLLANGPQDSLKVSTTSDDGAVEQSLASLLQQVGACFFHDEKTAGARFIAAHPGGFAVIRQRHQGFSYSLLQGHDELVQTLEACQDHYSPIVCEQTPPIPIAVREIASTLQPDTVQIYFQRLNAQQSRISISDPEGAIYSYHYASTDSLTLFNQCRRFVEQCLVLSDDQQRPALCFYQIDQVDAQSNLTITEVAAPYTGLSENQGITIRCSNPWQRQAQLQCHSAGQSFQGKDALKALSHTLSKTDNPIGFISNIVLLETRHTDRFTIGHYLALKARWERQLQQLRQPVSASA